MERIFLPINKHLVERIILPINKHLVERIFLPMIKHLVERIFVPLINTYNHHHHHHHHHHQHHHIIHTKLSQYSNFQIYFSTNPYDTINTSLNLFCLPTTVEIYNHIIKTKYSSKNVHLPLSSMKNILNTIYLFIHQIIFDSITSNTFPQCYKKSMIIPILKKPTLDTSLLLNYRPTAYN